MVDNYLQKGGKETIQKLVGAYVTFETEDGYNEVIQYIKHPNYRKDEAKKWQILGKRMKFEDCIEPTNVIWEGYSSDWKKTYFKNFIYLSIITILLFITFCGIVKI